MRERLRRRQLIGCGEDRIQIQASLFALVAGHRSVEVIQSFSQSAHEGTASQQTPSGRKKQHPRIIRKKRLN